MAFTRMRWDQPFLLSSLTAACLGVVAWRAWWLIALAVAIPVVVGGQRTRWQASWVALAYYSAASWPLVESHRSFAGDPTPSSSGIPAVGSRQRPVVLAAGSRLE